VEDVRIMTDPGTLATGFAHVRDLNGILISHDHADHFDQAGVAALMEHNPDATLVVDQAIAHEVPGNIFDRARTKFVSTGETFAVDGVEILAVGGTHATIHPEIEGTTNIGFYFTESGLLYPGDEFAHPDVDIVLLALPVSGPWQSLADTVDYLRAVDPPAAFPMHEAALTEPEVWYSFIDDLKPKTTHFQVLEPGVPTEL
jgi:L-ascorbate metabolism protein UlaG (beta-lactamase superfamily)